MTVNEALEIMNKSADSAVCKISDCGIKLKREVRYLNTLFAEVINPKRARYVTVALTLSVGEAEDEMEYCISIFADVKRGLVNEEGMRSSAKAFEEKISEIKDAYCKGASAVEILEGLCKEADAEEQRILSDLSRINERNRIISVIGTALVIVGVAIMFIVAMLG